MKIRNTAVASIFVIILASLTGCVNFREYRKDNLLCQAWYEPLKGWKYFSVAIGRLDQPYHGELPFSFKTPDGRIFTSGQLADIETAQALFKGHPPSAYSGWPTNAVVYTDKNIAIYTISNRVIHISLRGGPAYSIGDIGGKRFYPFPLSEKQVIEIFGPPETKKSRLMM